MYERKPAVGPSGTTPVVARTRPPAQPAPINTALDEVGFPALSQGSGAGDTRGRFRARPPTVPSIGSAPPPPKRACPALDEEADDEVAKAPPFSAFTAAVVPSGAASAAAPVSFGTICAAATVQSMMELPRTLPKAATTTPSIPVVFKLPPSAKAMPEVPKAGATAVVNYEPLTVPEQAGPLPSISAVEPSGTTSIAAEVEMISSAAAAAAAVPIPPPPPMV